MLLVTITSDLGSSDPYLAVIKGNILLSAKQALLVDISHNIPPFNLVSAAYVFKNAWKSFPEHSIHTICVHLAAEPNTRLLYFKHQNHHFLLPDNGLIRLIFNEVPEEVFVINNHENLSNSFARLIGDCVQKIATNQLVSESRTTRFKELINRQAQIYPDMIKGHVMYIDHFCNAVTNISLDIFQQVSKDRNFEISFNKNRITSISTSYADVPEGERCCIFNAFGMLEIAINQGKASSLLNIEPGQTIVIEFNSFL